MKNVPPLIKSNWFKVKLIPHISHSKGEKWHWENKKKRKNHYFSTAINSTIIISIHLFWLVFFPKLFYCWMSFLCYNHCSLFFIRVYQNTFAGCIIWEQKVIMNWHEIFVQYSFTKFESLSFHLPQFNLQKNISQLNQNSLLHSFPPYHGLQFVLSIPFYLIST